MFQFKTHSPQDTYEMGKIVARLLLPGQVICLAGDLGAGKTLLVQGIAAGLDIEELVTSPTFTVVNIYEGMHTLYHFDLYRLDHPAELTDIGYYEYVFGSGIAVIEWPDKFPEEIPEERLWIEICRDKEENERIFKIEATGQAYEKVCEELKEKCLFLV